MAKAFGMSSASVSYLAGCRPIDDRRPVTIAIDRRPRLRSETITPPNLNMRRSPDRKPRYQDVAREFDRLGETMFLRTYYTADIDARIERIEQKRPRPGDDRTPFSFNPKADSHAGVHNFGVNQFGVEECIRIVCDPKQAGCTTDAILTARNSANNGTGPTMTTTNRSAPRSPPMNIICDSPTE